MSDKWMITINIFPAKGRHTNELGYADQMNVITESTPAAWLIMRRQKEKINAQQRETDTNVDPIGKVTIAFARKMTAQEVREYDNFVRMNKPAEAVE